MSVQATQKLGGITMPKRKLKMPVIEIPVLKRSTIAWSLLFLLDVIGMYFVIHIDKMVQIILFFEPFE